MSYRVRVESFEGPFDLLLYLVSRQKVDIGSISISQIADQYLEEVRHLSRVDLDVASDFLVVAATLLEIKAASLLPEEGPVTTEDMEDLTPGQMRDMLVDQLVEYKKFKNAAAALSSRWEFQRRMHVRPFGPDRSLLTLVPDYLRGVTLDDLGARAAKLLARRDVHLLESEHIARKVVPLEERVKGLHALIKREGATSFSQLVGADADPAIVVVTFLALLELFKRRQVELRQDELFGDIAVSYIEGAELVDFEKERFDSDE